MQLLYVLFYLLCDPRHAEGLLSTAPDDLKTIDRARERIAAATAAALVTNTEPELLLSIAWHESRYVQNVVSQEERGLASCGEMTPRPVAHCQPSALVDNYLDGARHLVDWRRACGGHERCALLGYGGGYRALKRCQLTPGHYACSVDKVFQWRANLIKRSWRGAATVLRYGA